MNLTTFNGRPAAQVSRTLEQSVRAWSEYDDNHDIALDEAADPDKVQIRGKDGSLLRAEKHNLGRFGTRVTDLRTQADGSGSLFQGLVNLETEGYGLGQNIIRRADGGFEGYNVEVTRNSKPGPPEPPTTIAVLFTDEAPKVTSGEPLLALQPLSSDEAEKIWMTAESETREWDTYPIEELYIDREELNNLRPLQS